MKPPSKNLLGFLLLILAVLQIVAFYEDWANLLQLIWVLMLAWVVIAAWAFWKRRAA